jgi:hypothetical protein
MINMIIELYKVSQDFTDISLLKGEALLTVGYTIFGNKSYSYKMYS